MNKKLAETLRLWRPGIMALRGRVSEDEARARMEAMLPEYSDEERNAIRAMFKEIYQ